MHARGPKPASIASERPQITREINDAVRAMLQQQVEARRMARQVEQDHLVDSTSYDLYGGCDEFLYNSISSS